MLIMKDSFKCLKDFYFKMKFFYFNSLMVVFMFSNIC